MRRVFSQNAAQMLLSVEHDYFIFPINVYINYLSYEYFDSMQKLHSEVSFTESENI